MSAVFTISAMTVKCCCRSRSKSRRMHSRARPRISRPKRNGSSAARNAFRARHCSCWIFRSQRRHRSPTRAGPRSSHELVWREPEATAWKSEARLDGDHVTITLRGPGLPDANGLDAFVAERKLVDNKPPQIRRDGDALIVAFGKSDYFGTSPTAFDLVVTKPSAAGVRGWRVQVPLAAAPSSAP